MDKIALLPLCGSLPEYEKEYLEELRQQLAKIGVDFQLKEKGDHSYLLIRSDPAETNLKLKRDAGPRKKYLNRSVPIDEIRRQMKEKSADSVAKSLGVSRATLYRKLKDAERKNKDYVF